MGNKIYKKGKYILIIKNKKSELYIDGKYEHTVDQEMTKEEFKEHIKLAAETKDFNYSE